MRVEKKYEQWKAITESDFVTLFIKTWFTFIAVLRELNPDVEVFTKDGKPRGDKPFLNAFNFNASMKYMTEHKEETKEFYEQHKNEPKLVTSVHLFHSRGK